MTDSLDNCMYHRRLEYYQREFLFKWWYWVWLWSSIRRNSSWIPFYFFYMGECLNIMFVDFIGLNCSFRQHFNLYRATPRQKLRKKRNLTNEEKMSKYFQPYVLQVQQTVALTSSKLVGWLGIEIARPNIHKESGLFKRWPQFDQWPLSSGEWFRISYPIKSKVVK